MGGRLADLRHKLRIRASLHRLFAAKDAAHIDEIVKDVAACIVRLGQYFRYLHGHT